MDSNWFIRQVSHVMSFVKLRINSSRISSLPVIRYATQRQPPIMPYPGYEIQPPARQAYASESERPCVVSPTKSPNGLNVVAWALPRYYNRSPLTIYLYTPYSCVNSVIAFTFSTFAVINGTSTSMMKPPPSPMTSISFLQ
jgi:hypothetical protein